MCHPEGMISNLLLAVGVICLLIALLAFLGVVATPYAPLLVIGIITLVAGYFLRGTVGRRI